MSTSTERTATLFCSQHKCHSHEWKKIYEACLINICLYIKSQLFPTKTCCFYG